MGEPIYRWECTICDAAGEAESSEMARLTVNAHVAVAHATGATERPSTESGSQRTS